MQLQPFNRSDSYTLSAAQKQLFWSHQTSCVPPPRQDTTGDAYAIKSQLYRTPEVT